MTKIILVRHGQTVWNPQGRPRGRAELPLDDVGKVQAQATADYIAGRWSLDAVVASPLRRTMQTAQAIAAQVDLEVRTHDGLQDIDFGAWEGRLPEDLEAHWAEAWEMWLTRPQHVVIPGGETLQAAQRRAMAALREICYNNLDKTVVVVSHTGIIRLLILSILDAGLDHFWHIGQDMTAINELDFDGQVWTVGRLNLAEHLRDLAG